MKYISVGVISCLDQIELAISPPAMVDLSSIGFPPLPGVKVFKIL